LEVAEGLILRQIFTMICERCRQREAAVQYSIILSGPPQTVDQWVCDACLPDVEAERTASYNLQPDRPPPPDLEALTAEQLVDLCQNAGVKGVSNVPFYYVVERLKEKPETHERFSSEILTIAEQALKRGQEPPINLLFVECLGRPRDPQRAREQADRLEELIFGCFKLSRKLEHPVASVGTFWCPIASLLVALARSYPERLATVVSILKEQGGEAKAGLFWNMIGQFEKMVAP
jgi:hypothetical protein